jgi:Domain of unknown function (DUF1905)
LTSGAAEAALTSGAAEAALTSGAAEAALIKGAAEGVSEAITTDTITATAKIWLWVGGGAASWHFATITGAAADAIHGEALMRRLENGGLRRGFGAVKVRVGLNDTYWDTSIFPHKESGGWMLPIKASVRKAEGVGAGDEVTLAIELI